MNAVYRALLRLYPASYRADYATELERTFAESTGSRGNVGAVLAAVADVVPNALAVHRDILVQDLRYTLRTLARSRGFAVATILVTALGVGANTATFSFADHVLVRNLPYPDPDKIVRLCEGPRDGSGWGCMNQLSPANLRDVRASAASFTAIGAFTSSGANLVGAGEPVRVSGAAIAPDVMTVLGVPPLIGRAFDSTAADLRTVIISYGLWQTQFGGDRDVLGVTLSLDDTPYTVIGVMPARFMFPGAGDQYWVPLTVAPDQYENRNNNFLDAIARLRPGVTFEQARAELTGIFDRMARDYPASNAETGFSFFRQRDYVNPRNRLLLLALVGASLAMLLLTCANLASLQLARAASREREVAVRAALGAGRERLVRQMLTESVVLALLGGAAGVVLATYAMPLLSTLVPATMPLASTPTLDLRVLGFAGAMSALTGLAFGIVPALSAGGGGTAFAALREGARGGSRRTWLRSTLVSLEVAMSVVLLVTSGLMIRAMWRVQSVPTGFSTENVLTMRIPLSAQYVDTVRRADFYGRVTAGVAAIPGVEHVAFTTGLPLVLGGGITGIVPAGEAPKLDNSQSASMRLVTPRFFDALRIPLTRGRAFTDADTPDRQLVAVISESGARRHWPGQDPIGKVFSTRNQTRVIVGVVSDILVRGLERTNEPQLYLPAIQPPVPLGDLYYPKDLVVRSARPDPTLAAAVRGVIRQVDPQLPVTGVRMLEDVVLDQTATRRSQANMLAALAGLALLLTAVGIHGLLAFTVAQRDREIGVRLALGADPGSVARMVVKDGLKIAVLGVVPGVAAAYLAGRAMSAMLFGVEPHDPATLGGVAVACFVVAVGACFRPALRAARTHPMAALKSD